MSEDEVVKIVRSFIEGQFPRSCMVCGREYVSLADYLRNTDHLGSPISYDAEMGDWRPDKPVGTVSLANCSCGNTLAITSHGMKRWTMWRLLLWAKMESMERGTTLRELLADLRHKIDRSVLGSEVMD
jgi:hypothetical protein